MISRASLASWSGALLALALASAGPAAAQPAAPADAHYQAAEDAMARGAWADAAREYAATYELTHDAILQLKLGTAYQQAGQCAAASAAFDRYLAVGNPSPEYRAMTEDRRAACVQGATAPTPGGTAATAPAAATGATTTTTGTLPGTSGIIPGAGVDDPDTLASLGGVGGPSFTDTPTTWKRSAGWIAAGTTIGLVAVGTVLALSAEGSEEDLGALIDFRTGDSGVERPLRWDEIDRQYVDLVDEGKRFDKLATVTFTAAGITTAAAVTFFILDATTGHHEQRRLALAPRVDRDSASVHVGWKF